MRTRTQRFLMQQPGVNQFAAEQSARLRNGRHGFTLIELMVVIAVIGILLAMILPALSGVWVTSRDAQVASEIKGLETAISLFKTTYGMEPPSRITLMEIASQTPARDQAILRRLWPRFNFAANTYDWNGNGTPGENNTGVVLAGAECLVFFLGGMPISGTTGSTTTYACGGFSKNPANPFTSAGASGESREGPFFEFKGDRLVPSNRLTGFLIYVDPIPGHTTPYSPYVYASSYEGRGYEVLDLAIAGDAALTMPTSPLSDVYCQSNEDTNHNRVLDMGEDANMNGRLDIVYHNPKSFQILSPGADHEFGSGNVYIDSGSETKCGGGPDGVVGTADDTKSDFDNITNFHPSRLKR